MAKALIEEGAGSGRRWMAALLTVASALTAGALLRATGRIFAGWGPGTAAAGTEQVIERERPEHEYELRAPRSRITPSMLLPALGLLGAALAVGLVPGLSDRAVLAAGRFANRTAYAASLLGGGGPAPHATVPAPASGRLAGAALWAGVTLLLAVCGAAAALFGGRLPEGLRRVAGSLASPAARALRNLHSGHIADSVTWLTIGTAAFGVVLAAVLR